MDSDGSCPVVNEAGVEAAMFDDGAFWHQSLSTGHLNIKRNKMASSVRL